MIQQFAPESSIHVFVTLQSRGELAPMEVKSDIVETRMTRSSSGGAESQVICVGGGDSMFHSSALSPKDKGRSRILPDGVSI